MTYKGWTLEDRGAGYHPTTGRWRAMRHGVGMGHSTGEGLISMIDTRTDDERRLMAETQEAEVWTHCTGCDLRCWSHIGRLCACGGVRVVTLQTVEA